MNDSYIRFTGLISEVGRNVRRVTGEVIAGYGLKRSYVTPIYFLYRSGPMTASRLCRLCGEDKANISRTLKALEEDGYIRSEAPPSPHARIRHSLTDDGIAVAEFLEARVKEAVMISTRGLGDDEIECMYRVLERINENLSGILSELD
ncbi:MAG: MarR family transcriptional regulator [Clostridia bacterium]|nr:MarR family transcriptional regulator [Clostridia bacterium]